MKNLGDGLAPAFPPLPVLHRKQLLIPVLQARHEKEHSLARLSGDLVRQGLTRRSFWVVLYVWHWEVWLRQ